MLTGAMIYYYFKYDLGCTNAYVNCGFLLILDVQTQFLVGVIAVLKI